jgi:hypothetical protein
MGYCSGMAFRKVGRGVGLVAGVGEWWIGWLVFVRSFVRSFVKFLFNTIRVDNHFRGSSDTYSFPYLLPI